MDPGEHSTVTPFPFIVWGADEIRRALLRQRRSTRQTAAAKPAITKKEGSS